MPRAHLFSSRCSFHFPEKSWCQRIGWWENLQESPIFDGKNHDVSCRFSLKPTQWWWARGEGDEWIPLAKSWKNKHQLKMNWKWSWPSGKQTVMENLSCMNHAYVIVLWKLADEFPLWYKASSSRGVSIAMFDYRRAQEMIFGDWQYEHWKPFSSYGFQKKSPWYTHTPTFPSPNKHRPCHDLGVWKTPFLQKLEQPIIFSGSFHSAERLLTLIHAQGRCLLKAF